MLDDLPQGITEYRFPGTTLPCVFEAAAPLADPLGWLDRRRELLAERLQRHGALLLRNIGIDCVARFRDVVALLTPDRQHRYEAPTPRRKVAPDVFTSTEFPPDETIALHNEMSHCASWPDYVWFYCDEPPEQGGETPIADSRAILDRVPVPVREQFVQRGLVYRRVFHPRGDLLDWRTVFNVRTPAELYAYSREAALDARWLDDGRLVTTRRRDAIIRHPIGGEAAWFNQAHLFHASNLPDGLRAVIAGSPEQSDALAYDTCFGDGEPIPDASLDAVRAALDACEVRFRWQRGDVMLLDNLLAAHGRRPFRGRRRILVTMARRSERSFAARSDAAAAQEAGS